MCFLPVSLGLGWLDTILTLLSLLGVQSQVMFPWPRTHGGSIWTVKFYLVKFSVSDWRTKEGRIPINEVPREWCSFELEVRSAVLFLWVRFKLCFCQWAVLQLLKLVLLTLIWCSNNPLHPVVPSSTALWALCPVTGLKSDFVWGFILVVWFFYLMSNLFF